MAQKVLHKRSNQLENGAAKLPTASGLSYGEIAINYKAGNETIALKNDADEVVSFNLSDAVWERGTGENSVQQKGAGAAASGSCAVAEGSNTKALGNNSHAEGANTIAQGAYSHAEGYVTTTSNQGEHAEGKYNVSISGVTLHTVGIGTSSTRKNAHVITTDGKHYIPGIGTYVGTETTLPAGQDLATIVNNKIPMVSTTYSALKTLRDSSGLTPGMQYRITDYNTTTTRANTQSAGHRFDVIVTADDNHTLNENARAVRHSGDTYFTGSTLEAWEIKYDIDNDTTKFAWADSGATGRGVIYYMKDEWNNECPYDFKNIQFARWEQTSPVGYVLDENEWDYVVDSDQSWVSGYNLKAGFYSVNGSSNDVMLFYNEELGDYKKKISYTVSSTPTYCYTFGRGLDTSLGKKVYDNVIKEYYKSNKLQLNNIVFLQTTLSHSCYSNTFGNYCGSNTFGNSCNFNTFGNYCESNTFGNSCYSNTFGNYCGYNTFGDGCNFNTFGNYCGSNTFGNSCYSNTFGNYCESNAFDNDCRSNTFGNDCGSNTFGNSCRSNTFGNDCNFNTFGDGCDFNTFGNDCHSNTFGNDYQYNTFGNSCNNNQFGYNCFGNQFGNSCRYNTFGNYCESNTFGNECTYIHVLKEYVCYIIVENGNKYIDITSTQTTSNSSRLRNITIAQGVNNSTTRKTISHNTLNDAFKTTYQSANSQIINI